jgi:hypothetical protein
MAMASVTVAPEAQAQQALEQEASFTDARHGSWDAAVDHRS